MKTLDAGGARLEYRWLGPPPDAAPTLVFLHEGLGCVALWKDFPQQLVAATGCGALVYSRAGYGGSDPVALPRPLTYLHDEGRVVLPAVLDAARVRQAILVGHSDGASIAVVNVADVGDQRVLGAVLMAPHVFNEPACVDSVRRARHAYRHTGLRERLARYHGDNVDVAFQGWSETWLDPGFRNWDLTNCLPAIRVSLLVLQGENDSYGTAAQVDAIEHGVTAAVVQTAWLADCGHSPFRDQPAATLRAVAGFVTAVQKRTSVTSRAPRLTKTAPIK